MGRHLDVPAYRHILRTLGGFMAEPPPPQRPSRLRAFWSRRSWKGKAGIIVGAVVLALIVIGVAAPPEDKPESESSPAATTSEQPTTESTTTAEAT
jgi:hypothetical protein